MDGLTLVNLDDINDWNDGSIQVTSWHLNLGSLNSRKAIQGFSLFIIKSSIYLAKCVDIGMEGIMSSGRNVSIIKMWSFQLA